jgi:hypothetical protein
LSIPLVLDLRKYKAAEENKAKDYGLQIKQGSQQIAHSLFSKGGIWIRSNSTISQQKTEQIEN